MEDIHQAATAEPQSPEETRDTVEARDILAIQEPLVPVPVTAPVIAPAMALAARRTPPLSQNQDQISHTVVGHFHYRHGHGTNPPHLHLGHRIR